jgi:hypothetical protein
VGGPGTSPLPGRFPLGNNKLLPIRDEASPIPLHEPSHHTKHDKHYLLVVTVWGFVVVTLVVVGSSVVATVAMRCPFCFAGASALVAFGGSRVLHRAGIEER